MVSGWDTMLADDDQLVLVKDHLLSAAWERPQRVTELVRPHIGESEQWRSICSALLSRSLSPGLVPLATELLEGGHVDGVRGPIAVNGDFWTILYTLSEQAPSAAAKVMGAYLRRAAALSKHQGMDDPFDVEILPSRSSSGGERVISRIASGSPESYIDEVLPFVTNVLQKTAKTDDEKAFRHGGRWYHRYPGKPSGIDRALFVGLDTALRSLRDNRVPELLAYIRPLMTSDIEELRFLACRALATSSLADGAVQWLISDPRNFDLGYAGDRRWATLELIQTATRTCEPELLQRLSTVLLEHYPRREKSALGRPHFGYAQYELLTAIVPTRRNALVIRRLQELERKFGILTLAPPQASRTGVVGAPIPEPAAKFLSDDQWLKAIRTYETDAHRRSHAGGLMGGVHELSVLTSEQAAKEPDRFARLAMRLTSPAHAVHIGAIIRSVAGKIHVDLLAQLCEHGRQIAGESIGRDICWAVEKAAADVTDTLIRLVISCCSDEDPERETAQIEAGSGNYFFNGELSNAGLNCTRGAAAGCLASILLAQPHRSGQLLGTIRELAEDANLAVRVRTAEAILALLNTMPEQALDIAEEMFATAPAEIFDSHECIELLKHSCLRRSEKFSLHLHRALEANESTAKRAGYPWIVAYVNGTISAPAPEALCDLNVSGRVGVAETLAGSLQAAPSIVVQLLNDEDADVREAASRTLWRVHELDQQTAEMIVQEFMKSPSFRNHMGNLFASLEQSTTLLPPSTIDACERAVASVAPEFGGTAQYIGSFHLVSIVLRLYKQGNEGIRRRCLDVIDRLSDLGAYGLEEALDQERL
jgi:hypothetical protein